MDLKTLLEQINDAPKILTELMEDLKVNNEFAFKKVLRGFPEKSITTYGGDIGVCYLKKINFNPDFDEINRPTSLDMTLGCICKGTKTEVHDKITKLNLDILNKFIEDDEWFTLKGVVESVVIEDHEIFIESMKNSLLTTSIFELKCELHYHNFKNLSKVNNVNITGDIRSNLNDKK
jgi:hypothetical protein